MEIGAFQKLIRDTYHRLDGARGVPGNFLWFIEEVGELAEALRHGDTPKADLENEFADVFAWLASLANIRGIDLERAVLKYKDGCPRCRAIPCACDHPESHVG